MAAVWTIWLLDYHVQNHEAPRKTAIFPGASLLCGVDMEIKIELDTHDASLLVAISSYCNIPIETLVRYWVRRELATHMVK